MIYVHPQAKPFFLAGGKEIGLLFIHGFTASPSEVLPVAQILHQKQKITVSGILLPGHGTHPAFLNQTTWQDWYRAVEQEASYLLAHYAEVYLAGLSMGGLLALHAAASLPGIKGVITINAPIYNRYPVLTWLAPVIQWIKPYFPKKKDKRMQELERKGRFAYRCHPVRAFRSMQDLRALVVKELPFIEVPVLALQSVYDEAVDVKSLSFIIENIKKAEVKGVKLYHSGHIATMEEPEKVAEEIISFI
ncbi:carboxylesterase [Thermosyntropha lipolytica DSM 11003]|uniref:Carboxylesterase n=1 Tax=Thermosyntropha lipolytica DSM 11003 TaxID=1123382 RepID=A0A1M5MHJ6_9FIRM|nr:alpha/beta fold hydrolase [Thermosyntropha lipolytica]SHG76409.1 carboxylesterase [Thermosyntropha lipolytica DSM 11003]